MVGGEMRAEVGGGVRWQRLAATSNSIASALPSVPGTEEQRLMGRRFQGIFILMLCSF